MIMKENKNKKEKSSSGDEELKKSDIALKEEEILKFWQENKIFEKSETKGGKEFIFYDGPPFATGLPHHGHILAGTIKDAIPRYKTMKGDRVTRRWGWDCHGLPIENIIEKTLGLKTKKDIEIFGIDKFNQAARKEVLRYVDDWKRIIPRMGRWVDMENPYQTMDPNYTESVWWAFKTLYDKNLIYRGFKSMHLCPRCETTLSNFEVAQGYKDITDLSVIAKFELADEPGTYFLAWTTTPWTLPGNMAVAVNPEIIYVKAEKDGIIYVLAKDRISVMGDDVRIIKEWKGSDLVGKSYNPPFDYYQKIDFQNKENAWKVYGAEYVKAEDGTGIVHIAPPYGAEDLTLAQKENIPIVYHVGFDGVFKKEITDFTGFQAKPKDDHQSSDVLVIKNLASRNLLFHKEKIIHPYPHCWRCDTPLLNYAATSWFVNIQKIKSELVSENKKIDWIPIEIRDGRFGKMLESAPDWAISRSRYWGAPLPVWQCLACESQTVIGSLSDLKKFSKKSGNQYFLMRHGEAQSNASDISSSSYLDRVHLTEKGRAEVESRASEVKEKEIDLIFASDFARTKETAFLIAKSVGIEEKEIIFDKRLREIDTGIFSGKPNGEYHNYFFSILEKFDKRPPEGENLNDLRCRTMEFLYEVEEKYKGKKILIVTHEYACWMMIQGAMGWSNRESAAIKETKDDFIKTAEVLELPFAPLPHDENFELDLHRPYIDNMELSCECGGVLKRIPEVFDCWFESGSMPYAQFHYPFEKEKFDPVYKKGYPANFIAEGLDQTRGWFYSMLVLGTALFGEKSYERVIVNGLILAEDGQKMAKKLKNYPDPMDVVDRYGSDALRYYLLSSPVVKGEDLNFSENGVDEVVKKISSRLDNVFSFYELYRVDVKSKSGDSRNILDKWILARLGELSSEVTEAMENYELDKATKPFLLFIDDLSTWYLRRSRERFKGNDAIDKEFATLTTCFVLLEVSKLLAPFMPFLSERIFQKLRVESDAISVHLEDWPKVGNIDHDLLKKMKEVRNLVSLGLEARSKQSIKVRQPLKSLSIKNKEIVENEELSLLIKDEVNVKELLFHSLVEEVLLDVLITPELRLEGVARDLIREIQDERKKLGLSPNDAINVQIKTSDIDIQGFSDQIGKAVNASRVEILRSEDASGVLIEKL